MLDEMLDAFAPTLTTATFVYWACFIYFIAAILSPYQIV